MNEYSLDRWAYSSAYSEFRCEGVITVHAESGEEALRIANKFFSSSSQPVQQFRNLNNLGPAKPVEKYDPRDT